MNASGGVRLCNRILDRIQTCRTHRESEVACGASRTRLGPQSLPPSWSCGRRLAGPLRLDDRPVQDWSPCVDYHTFQRVSQSTSRPRLTANLRQRNPRKSVAATRHGATLILSAKKVCYIVRVFFAYRHYARNRCRNLAACRFCGMGRGAPRGWWPRNSALDRWRALGRGRHREDLSLESGTALRLDSYPTARTGTSEGAVRVRGRRRPCISRLPACEYCVWCWFQSTKPEMEFCDKGTNCAVLGT